MSRHLKNPRHSAGRADVRRGFGAVVIALVGALVVGAWGVAPVAAEVSPTPEATESIGSPDGPDATAEETPAPANPVPSADPTEEPAAPVEEPVPGPVEPGDSVAPSTDTPDPAAEPTDPGLQDEPTASEPAPESDRAPPETARAGGDFGTLAAGIPEAPRQVWIEAFEQGLTNTASGLAAYSGGRYTASTGWANGTACTGVLVNYLSPYPNPAFCPTQPLLVVGQSSVAAREIRRMADVLGQVAAGVTGSTSASSPTNGSTTGTAGSQGNHALVSLPYGTVAGGTTVLTSATGIGVAAPASRYYALRMNAVGAQCGTNNASLSLNLVSGGTTLLTGFASPVVPCTATGNVFYTSPAQPGLPTLGGVLDPALSASVRAGNYSGTNTALLSPAQIAAAQVQLVNTVTGAGSGFGVDNLRVIEVTPALDASFGGAAATATVPTTLTFTITNTGELLAKTDWGFATALPAGLTVAPTPAVAGSCANVAGTAFVVTAAAGSSTVTASGGDLAAGAASCTITVDVVASGAGTYSSGTVTPTGLIASAPASITVAAATTITVRKNLPARTAAADQFTVSLRTGTSVLASATTSGIATGIQAAQVSRYVVQPGSTYTVHEAQTSGAGIGYSNGYECTRGGTVIGSGSGASGAITVPNEVGAEVICTFTNTVQTPRLFCDTNHFYSITAAGALQQGDIVSGTLAQVGSWTGATASNALGIGAGGTVAYAIERSADATDVASILKWTPGSGFQTLANSSYTTVAGGTAITGSLVAGAVDLSGSRYLFGTFLNSQFYIWSFTESNPTATRFAFLGSFPTGAAPNGNGDMAFDARGNLYVVGASTVNGASSAAIYTVTAETLAAASGGTLAVNTSATRALTGTDAAFANVNGIAFSPRGTVYLANAGSAYEFDATTWNRVSGTARVPVDSVDLAGCSSPSTITLQKNIVGRQAASDQFQLTASAGTPLTAFATSTTTGATLGRQTAQIGPFPAPIGSTVAISEAMAAGSASAIAAYTTIYECWADGVRLSSGNTTTGAVTMPTRLSVNVNCTYFNSPRPASTVRITKTIQEFSGLSRPGVDWTVGTTATATTGTATALPSEAPRQQTDAAGQASWTVLFGSDASRATVTVSEVQQTGFAFVSGSCTVNGTARAVAFTQTGTVVSGSLTGIASASAIECTIVNRPTASLTLVKTVGYGSALPTDWTLSATGPAGALPGPTGRSGTAAASGVSVTPGVAYRLAESGGPLTYVQTGAWQCRTATGATVAVSAAGDVTPVAGAAVTCTVGNSTSSITLVKQVLSPRTGFQASDWRVTATPASIAGGTLPTETRAGAEYSASGNAASTFDVRPGHGYTLSEAATDPNRRLAYQELRLERLTGSTWTAVTSRTILAPAAGETAVYRFVNAPVEPTRLPLTGGTSADAFLIGGGAVLTAAFALLVWTQRRRLRGAFR
ncbi:hypothetical protein C5E11_05040 [Clavibacter michiganensis]|nr:LPXTG cell wall anchor domain-containing protein [Clavibacter michiganensis]PPF64077.1 hypothetical protein C5E11_05040 [Clavibacter michiganensis]